MTPPLFVRVNYHDDQKKFFTKKIMEVKENMNDPDDIYIQPYDINDFDKRKTYFAKWKCDENCQKQHKHYEYKPCFIMFLAENEDDIPVIEKNTRNRIPKLFSDERVSAPLKSTKPAVAPNNKKIKEGMKRKTLMSRSQSVLSSLKYKSYLENFNDTSDDGEEVKAKSPKKRPKLNQTLLSMKFPELKVCLEKAQFDSQKTLDNGVTESEMTVSESELSDESMSISSRETPNKNDEHNDKHKGQNIFSQFSDQENVDDYEIPSGSVTATNNNNNQGLQQDCTANLSASQQIRPKDTDNILQSEDNQTNKTDNNHSESNKNIGRRNSILNQNNQTSSDNPDQATIPSHETHDPPLAHGSQKTIPNTSDSKNSRCSDRQNNNSDDNRTERDTNNGRQDPVLNNHNRLLNNRNLDQSRRQQIRPHDMNDPDPRNANPDNLENLRNSGRQRRNQPQDIIKALNNKSYKTRGDSIKLVIACCEYYIQEGSPGVEDRRRRYQVTGDMVYLGEGLSVTSVGFGYMCKEPIKPFLRWLALEIWGHETLMNRAMQNARVNPKSYLPGRSPTKQIEDELLRLFISVFHDYTEKRTDLPLEERTQSLHNITVELSLIIRDLRTDYRKSYAKRRL